jgi:hypothetical protein
MMQISLLSPLIKPGLWSMMQFSLLLPLIKPGQRSKISLLLPQTKHQAMEHDANFSFIASN